MPTHVTELLSGGPPERYDGRRPSDRGSRRLGSRRRPPAAVRVTAGVLAALGAVAVVGAMSSSGRAPAQEPTGPVAEAGTRSEPAVSPELRAALRELHSRRLSGQSGTVPAGGLGPSAATARGAAESLLGRNCITGRTSDLSVTADEDWLEVDVRANPPQTRPLIFSLHWAGSGYRYQFPKIPDACP